jgi:alkylresorcinol/alkylpyrone synthase
MSSMSTGTKAAVAGGAVALLGLAATAGFLGLRRSKQQKRKPKPVTTDDDMERKIDDVRPTTGTSTSSSSSTGSRSSAAAALASAASAGGIDRNARILALASAFPPNVHKQQAYLEAFIRNNKMDEADESFARRVWAGTKIDTCSSFLREEDLFRKMTREEYVAYIKPSLRTLALTSAREALAQWGGEVKAITHIVFGTMTGSIHAPTMDAELAIELGLRTDIKRLNVEGMGCLTGYRCLGLANDIARADPQNLCLLIVCDIRSALGNQLPAHVPGSKIDKANVIVSALFRDSGAAAIVGSTAWANKSNIPPALAATGGPLYEIISHRSLLLPDTFKLVRYHEKNDSVIYLYIDKELPCTIRKVLRGAVSDLLEPHRIPIQDCTYSVHTGGPAILHAVEDALGVDPKRLASSWYIMGKYGNLSGSSNLVVLDHWRKLPSLSIDGDSREHVVCMSFGPGIGMELLLLRALPSAVPFSTAPSPSLTVAAAAAPATTTSTGTGSTSSTSSTSTSLSSPARTCATATSAVAPLPGSGAVPSPAATATA